jgi:hypothetical protein
MNRTNTSQNLRRAFVLIIGLALTTAACTTSEGEAATTSPPTTVAASPLPTQPPATTTTEPTVTPAEAIAVANAWYVAFNAGDIDAVMALFAPDARVGNTWFGYGTLEDEQVLNTWDAAQGTALTTVGCTADDAPATIQQVGCEGANYDTLVQAVGSPPVPANVTMTIGPDGIAELLYAYGDPELSTSTLSGFNHVGRPFEVWMQANHAEVDMESLDWGDSIEEAEVSGLLQAQYAAEWAAYLDANDCTYLDGC